MEYNVQAEGNATGVRPAADCFSITFDTVLKSTSHFANLLKLFKSSDQTFSLLHSCCMSRPYQYKCLES